jgi:hypothetical protein
MGTVLRITLALLAALAPFAAAAATPFERTFERLYSFDFRAAHAELNPYIEQHPDEPLPYAIRSAIHLFFELDRLGILEGEFFASDKRIGEKKKLKADPAIRAQILQAIEDARVRAERVLASRPDDRDALFAMCMAQGVTMDYMALVEKRQFASLSKAKQSNQYAQRLLRIDPQFYDAYLTAGVTEYLVGSLPFFVRWFVSFENVRGSKQAGIENLRLVAEKGRYLKPFAKILLSIVYLREKQPGRARSLLIELTREYPENPLLRKELARLNGAGGQSAN